MATTTIYPTADGFLNNISGYYGSEGFLLARSTSSSDADYCETYVKFTSVGAGIGASDTINSVTFYIYCYSFSDPAEVWADRLYSDTTPVWGSWDDSTAPSVPLGMSYGTNLETSLGINTTGWFSRASGYPSSFPKSGVFSFGIKASLGDVGPAAAAFHDKTHSTLKPYVVIDYTPAATNDPYPIIGAGYYPTEG